MYCLNCGQEIAYSSLDCPQCDADLRYPSHGYGDHVSQLLKAVEAVCSDEITREDGEALYRQFVGVVEDFLRYWRLDSHPQLSRRAVGLSCDQQESLSQLEQSLPLLQRALKLYDEGFHRNCRQTLTEANSELEAFFRASCAALARFKSAFPQ